MLLVGTVPPIISISPFYYYVHFNSDNTLVRIMEEGLSSNGIACYTNRDLILYAAGIGCCNKNYDNNTLTNSYHHYDNELRHVYEHHTYFQPFPTFLLVLPFRAVPCRGIAVDGRSGMTDKMGVMPPFPTLLMKQMNIMKYILHQNGQENINTAKTTNYNLHNKGTENNIIDNSIGNGNDNGNHMIETVIHLSEQFTLQHPIPIPSDSRTTCCSTSIPIPPSISIQIQTNTISIIPKSIGLIVTTETKYYHQLNCQKNHHESVVITEENENKDDSLLLATSQSTTLYKFKKEYAHYINTMQPFHSLDSSSLPSSSLLSNSILHCSPKERNMIVQKYITQHYKNSIIIQEDIPYNQAILYRLSGDTNPIHVVVDNKSRDHKSGSESRSTSSSNLKPILHGLCTLGYAVRIIMNYCHDQYSDHNDVNVQFRHVSCDFVKPIFIGDSLEFMIWEYNHVHHDHDQSSLFLLFQITRSSDQVIVVKNGVVEVKLQTNCITSKL
jgi:hypothetical protein